MSRYYDEPSITVTTKPALGLGTIGIITGIVLCVLQGVGTINIGWFWATFPFWIVPAVELAIIIVLAIVAIVAVVIDDIIERKQ